MAYHEAVCSLANACGDKAQQVYDENIDELPSGTPVKDATPEELRRYTLAFHRRARDHLTPGKRPRDVKEWYSIAGEAIYLYKQRHTASTRSPTARSLTPSPPSSSSGRAHTPRTWGRT